MGIRLAVLSDIPELVEGASRMHAMTRFRDQPFSAQRTAESFTALIRHDKGRYLFLVAEGADKRIVGALIAVVERQIFSEAFTATVMHIDVLPEARMGGYGVKLLRAFEQWAANRNAYEICMGANSSLESNALAAFVGRLGYRRVGENYVKGAIR